MKRWMIYTCPPSRNMWWATSQLHAVENTSHMYQKPYMLHIRLSSNLQIISDGKLPLLRTQHSTAITCFSHRHFHQAAEAATLDLLRPTVCESDTVSLLCHTGKLNLHTNNWVSFQHGPWHFCLTRLNITGHPEALDSSPPEVVNLIWAAALYFIERAYRVSRGVYSHRGRVSFGVRCLCAFLCGSDKLRSI